MLESRKDVEAYFLEKIAKVLKGLENAIEFLWQIRSELESLSGISDWEKVEELARRIEDVAADLDVLSIQLTMASSKAKWSAYNH